MRAKLRRVKDKFSKQRKDSVVDASRTNSDDSDISVQPSLLGLPAEIRNDIYHYLAESTELTLAPWSSPKKRPSPVGLLLTCKQICQEYRPILMSRAVFIIRVHDYKFSVIVRTFEKLSQEDLTLMQMNPQLWIYLEIGHVPSRDDRRALRAWCDYRSDIPFESYFNPGRRIPKELAFQYAVHFQHHLRPPRPTIRYATGIDMKLDVLRSHIRMAARLQGPEETENHELRKFRDDLGNCAKLLEDNTSTARRASVISEP